MNLEILWEHERRIAKEKIMSYEYNPVETDGTTEIERCSRCGKPKFYIGDWWGQYPPPWCTCTRKELDLSSTKRGWQCPVCKRVYAPYVRECVNCCSPEPQDYTITWGGLFPGNTNISREDARHLMGISG